MGFNQIRSTLIKIREDFKKHKPTFKRYHSERYKRVKESWRKPRGLDNKMRKKYRGVPEMPGKRYGKPAVIKDILPCGFREVIIRNLDDLRALASLKERYCGTIFHGVGARKRIEIVNEAENYGIHLTNAKAKLMEFIEE